MPDPSPESEKELRILRRQLEREKSARAQAEAISEKGLRDLYAQQQEANLLREIATLSNETETGLGILKSALTRFAIHLRCSLATAWLPAPAEPGSWRHSGFWHFRGERLAAAYRDVTSDTIVDLRELVGHDAVVAGQPAMVELEQLSELSEIVRLARGMGMPHALTMPVVPPNGEAVALMEFYFESAPAELEPLFEFAWMIGNTIAKVFEREQLRNRLEWAQSRLEDQVVDQTREIGKLADQYQYSEERFRNIIANLGEVVFKTDAHGRLILLNDFWSTITGWSIEECLDRKLGEFVAAEEGLVLDHLWDTIMADGIPVKDIAFRLRQQDGGIRWVELNARRLTDSRDGSHRVVGTLFDISEHERTQEELRRANDQLERAARMKDEFLASMSHELRTPLNSVLGFAEILTEGMHGELNESQAKAVRNIAGSGSHLLALINDILDLSKIEANKEELELKSVNPAEILGAGLLMVKEQAQKQAVQLQLNDNCGNGLMLADPRRLKQILVNLLSNAVKFTLDGGTVSLSAEFDETAGEAIFRVADTGIGISEADQKKVFESFTQIDSQLSRQHAGTGLGLALVKRLAELHQGTVSLSSRLGHGSTFTVRLPRRLEEAQMAPVEPVPHMDGPTGPAAAPPSPTKKVKPLVLIVDDNLQNRELAATFLKAKHYAVAHAVDGLEGIATARERQPQLILMDLQMPGLDGLEATRRLKADAATADIPVIALTAQAMEGDREACLEAGAVAYLSKPVKLKDLINAVESNLHDFAATPV